MTRKTRMAAGATMRSTLRTLVLALAVAAPAAARADNWTDWDAWYDGDVEVRVKRSRGEGAVYAPGENVRLEFEANEDAYHLVYGIDTDGYVRVLFPRFWEDDGWVSAGHEVRLREPDLAWPAHRWGSDGIVYIEAIASPVPFDWEAIGIVRDRDFCGWVVDRRPFRISGDPFLAFNDIHRRLFTDWEYATFAVDYTYFYVGARYDAPRYLGYEYARVYVPPPHPRFYVSVRFGWHWELGYGYCRPMYVRYYHPGRYVVYHQVYHHVVYPARRTHDVVVHDTRSGGRHRVKYDTRQRRHRERVRDVVRDRNRDVARVREAKRSE
ncbi:MAG: DUF4384 domain-containing protein, partial [Candidatus Krumholzibacteriia bacterium]